jgi:DNA modification methylase
VIHYGDCREVLPTLPAESVHCCVTSPPYFGLRDYGRPNQIGLEQTPDEYVAQMVAVFREVRRVLRDDGTLWLNLGDSYFGSTMTGGNNGINANGGDGGFKQKRQFKKPKQYIDIESRTISEHLPLKPKDLIGIPWRVAFALQADGWYLRQDIIWHKPNPMPESVTDRCTKAHEYIFLLSKSARYWYDAEAIAEARVGEPPVSRMDNHEGTKRAQIQSLSASTLGTPANERRNRRSVWTVVTQPYSGAHFAVFPPALIEPCILAGCPSGGTVLDPFFGSGTTGEVCNRLGRQWVGIELNEDYAALQRERTSQGGLSL